jgi:hypothetical protein
MKPKDYQCRIDVVKTPAEAFAAIQQVSGWWTENFEGHSRTVNDVFTVHFGKTFVRFKVLESRKNSSLLWEVTECYLDWLKDKKEWLGSRILWEIAPKNSGSEITMTHIGLVPGIECFESCREGWNHFIQDSLFRLVSENKGLPEKAVHKV